MKVDAGCFRLDTGADAETVATSNRLLTGRILNIGEARALTLQFCGDAKIPCICKRKDLQC